MKAPVCRECGRELEVISAQNAQVVVDGVGYACQESLNCPLWTRRDNVGSPVAVDFIDMTRIHQHAN